MPVILLISLLMLGCLVVAADRLAWVRAGLLSVLLLALSAWWLVDRLSGDGLNAAFETSPGVKIVARTDVASGLVRSDHYDCSGNCRSSSMRSNPLSWW